MVTYPITLKSSSIYALGFLEAGYLRLQSHKPFLVLSQIGLRVLPAFGLLGIDSVMV
jgi:hypothetical protein